VNLNIYFLRHGETTASKTGGFCGTLDPELTSEGLEMAKDFAAVYKDFSWEAIFCSPLRRTLETVQPLLETVKLDLNLRKELKEIAYGRWEGLAPDYVNREFHDEYVRWQADPGWNSPTGGERGVDVARRSSIVLEEIEQSHPSGNVLVVSHKATTRIMLCSLLGIDIGRYRDRIGMPVVSIAVVEMTEQGPLLKVLGDRSHLRKELRLRPGT